MKYKFMRLLTMVAWFSVVSVSLSVAEKDKVWPDIPLLDVITENGEFPDCTVLHPPVGCVGTGITADYVLGRLTMTLAGDTLYESGEYVKGESGMRIKIRGNSTGAAAGQKPYKIKLSKKFDLLCRGDKAYKEKDWNLLKISTWNTGLQNEESNLLTALGFILSRTVGMEWVPEYTFVNLVMNGRYMGLYYLTDAVERGDKRVDIQKTGFLIENDAYWWKEDVYFKTAHQITSMGYTFKYPDTDDLDDKTMGQIRQYMDDFEKVLFSGGDVGEYIDLRSFARWLLVQDITYNDDVAGSNMYLYKDDYDESVPMSTKLKMGPLWDFDAMFRGTSYKDQWGLFHSSPFFYYGQLFEDENFVEVYKEEWEAVKPILMECVEKGFADLEAKFGTALVESFELHKTLYPRECKNSLQAQMDELMGLLRERISVMDRLMEDCGESGIKAPEVVGGNMPERLFSVDGRQYLEKDGEKFPTGLYIRQKADGTVEKFISR